MPGCSIEGCEGEGFPYKCKLCGNKYCGKHRLPEFHNCPGLIYYQSQEYKKSKAMRYAKKTGTPNTYSATEVLQTSAPPSIFGPYSTGNYRKDLFLALFLGWAAFGGISLLVDVAAKTKDIVLLPFVAFFPLIPATFVILGRINLARKGTYRLGGNFTMINTLFSIILTLITSVIRNIFPLLWVGLGFFLYTGMSASPSRKGRLVIGSTTYVLGIAFLINALSIVFHNISNLIPESYSPILTYLANSFEYAVLPIAIYPIFFLFPVAFPGGVSEGRVLLEWGLKWLLLAFLLVIVSIYLLSYNLTLMTLLLLSTAALGYAFYEAYFS